MNPVYTETFFQTEATRLPKSFAILTAWNPQGKHASQEKNQENNNRLLRELQSRNLSHFPIWTRSKTGSCGEACLGIDCSETEALELAKHFDQEAIFYIEDGKVILVGCQEDLREEIATWESRLEAS